MMNKKPYVFFKKDCSPNKRSFRGPGSAVRGSDSRYQVKICARELASVASMGSPVACRPLNAKIKNAKLGRDIGQCLNVGFRYLPFSMTYQNSVLAVTSATFEAIIFQIPKFKIQSCAAAATEHFRIELDINIFNMPFEHYKI